MSNRASHPPAPDESGPPPAEPAEPTRARQRGHGLWEWVEASGIELVGIGRLRFLLRRFGITGLVILILIAGYPVGQYSLISHAVNSSLPVLAGDFGVRFEAEEWSYHPLALKAIARRVRVVPAHDTGGSPLFTAAEVEFKGSLTSTLRGLAELVRFRRFHTFNEIVIRYGQLNLERSRTGALNWTEYAEAVPDDRLRELMAGLYRIRAVVVENASIAYVEHLVGRSGGGVIQTAQAAFNIDGINGAITDIRPARADDNLPTRVRASARSSDGLIDVEGRMALGPDRAGDGRGEGLLNVSTAASRRSGPGYELVFVLNNVGAAAFTRSLPATAVKATGGSVHGRITLRHDAPTCETDLRMENVTYAATPELVPSRQRYDTLQRQLRDRAVSKPFTGCPTPVSDPAPDEAPAAPPLVAIAASFNEQANADAPQEVRLAVAQDSQALTGRASTLVLQEMARHLPPGVAAMVDDPASPAGNAVTRGAASVGSGIRRLFGGGGSGGSNRSRPNRPPGR